MTIDFLEPPTFTSKLVIPGVFTSSKTDGKHRMLIIVTRHHKKMLWVNGVRTISCMYSLFEKKLINHYIRTWTQKYYHNQ